MSDLSLFLPTYILIWPQTTHRNLTSELPMVAAVQKRLIPRRDVMIGVLPYFHIYGMPSYLRATFRQFICHPGLAMLLFYPFYCGFPVVVLPRFDPEQFCRSIERYKVTVAFVVPPIILVLVRHPGEREFFTVSHFTCVHCRPQPLANTTYGLSV